MHRHHHLILRAWRRHALVCIQPRQLSSSSSSSRSSSSPGPYRDLIRGTGAGAQAADAALAGLGLWGSISALGCMEAYLGLPLFAPPMLASGIVFFIAPEPPHAKGFLSGTVCSATLSLGALTLLSPVLPPVPAHGATAATLLVWYKLTGSIFPPAAVLAGLLAGTAAGPLSFLAFPWLAGHCWLYGCAKAVSAVRARARLVLTRAALLGKSEQELHAIFNNFDTSGDGALDAHELRIALRVAVGVDLSSADCHALVDEADVNGTGTLCFDEFRSICYRVAK